MTVADVVRAATHALEGGVGTVWIEGETVSVVCASSGHIYFCLKDRRSQLRAVMWRSDAARLRFAMEDGLHLRCRGRLGIYERDGKFQLYVQVAEPAGLGAAALALEQLKAKLAAEGLFDAQRKRPLPHLPRRIGVVTSKSGAAVRDIIQAVQRRYPVPILVADAVVQGPSAPTRICRAIAAICRTDVDVLIVGRGGGSADDLSAFNDERVVRAIAGCSVPVISAVGHEIDTSLADLAADHRAATPTMAGEMAVPVLVELEALLIKEERRLGRELALRLRDARQDVDRAIGQAERRFEQAMARRKHALAEVVRTLEAQHPAVRLAAEKRELTALSARLDACVRTRLERAARGLAELDARVAPPLRRRVDRSHRELADLAARLGALSPLAVLERGYAIAKRGAHVVSDCREVAVGEPLEVRLARGVLDCEIRGIRDASEAPSGRSEIASDAPSGRSE